MEKLIKLLNEHRREKVKKQSWITQWHYNGYTFSLDNLMAQQAELLIISKQYWFIEWLVENEKIDRDNVRLRKSLWETDTSDIDEIIYTIKNSDYHYVMREAPYEAEETLLMLLSISDTPIEDLISYLK